MIIWHREKQQRRQQQQQRRRQLNDKKKEKKNDRWRCAMPRYGYRINYSLKAIQWHFFFTVRVTTAAAAVMATAVASYSMRRWRLSKTYAKYPPKTERKQKKMRIVRRRKRSEVDATTKHADANDRFTFFTCLLDSLRKFVHFVCTALCFGRIVSLLLLLLLLLLRWMTGRPIKYIISLEPYWREIIQLVVSFPVSIKRTFVIFVSFILFSKYQRSTRELFIIESTRIESHRIESTRHWIALEIVCMENAIPFYSSGLVCKVQFFNWYWKIIHITNGPLCARTHTHTNTLASR